MQGSWCIFISMSGKSPKKRPFSETIAACDLKVIRDRQLIEFLKICEYLKSRSFLNLGPRLFMCEN